MGIIAGSTTHELITVDSLNSKKHSLPAAYLYRLNALNMAAALDGELSKDSLLLLPNGSKLPHQAGRFFELRCE